MSPFSRAPRALFRSRERYGLRRLLDVVDGTPRWAVLAAYGTVVSVLPSAVWRTAVGLPAEDNVSRRSPRLRLNQHGDR